MQRKTIDNRWAKSGRALIMCLLVVSVLVVVGFPSAKAAAASFAFLNQGTATTTSTLTTFAPTFNGNVPTAYSTMVLQVMLTTGNPASGTGVVPSITSVTDNGAAAEQWVKFTSQSSSNANSNNVPVVDTEWWYAQILGTANSGTVTLTVNVAGAPVIAMWSIGWINQLMLPATTFTSGIFSSGVALSTGTYGWTQTLTYTAPSLITVFADVSQGTCSANCINGTPYSGTPFNSPLALVTSYGQGIGDQAGSNLNPCGTVAASTHCSIQNLAAQVYVSSAATTSFTGQFVFATMPTGSFWNFMEMTIDWVQSSVSTSGPGVVVIGSCPTKNTATTTLANNTEYFFTGSSISGASVTTVNTFVAQVTSATAPQTLSLGIYATLNAGPVSASNTLFLIAAFTKSLTAGTTNNAINWAPAVNLASTIVGAIPTGATIGIAVLGTNKIKINQSSLAGMSTGSTSGGVLASTYTSLTSSVTQLYLCMNLSYQTIITTTSTTTATTTSTTTNTITTAGGGSTPSSFITNPQTPVLFLTLLLPTIVMLFVSRNVVGALVGLGIGSVIAVSAGVLDKFLFFALIIGIVAAAFLARNRDE